MQLLRHQRVMVEVEPSSAARPVVTPTALSRAERAHTRLSWGRRLARNSRCEAAGSVSIHLFGVPARFATFIGLATT